jgi:hypothetical protein
MKIASAKREKMFNEDILEQAAKELENVQDMFAMPDPGYELKLRQLAGKLLDYRENLIEAENMLFWDDDIKIENRDSISEKIEIPKKV